MMMHAYLVAIVFGSLVSTDPPHAARMQEPSVGKTVYGQSCKKCHGAAGAPSQAMKRMMKTLPVLDSALMSGLSLSAVEDVIKKGKGEMKPIDKLTAEETAAVSKYVFELAKVKPLAAKSSK